jgi:hypothetical protein
MVTELVDKLSKLFPEVILVAIDRDLCDVGVRVVTISFPAWVR